ncbi:hypothetical protein Tco_0973682 [Tanacetum coccineum]
MLNKDNYVPWSSHLLRYAKSKPNGKLLMNSIKNGPYVRRIIHEPGDPNSVPPVAESTHEQTDDELTDQESKQVEADDQAIQTILMGLREDIYAAIDSFSGMSVWDGAEEKEPTTWEGVKTQLDTAQEVQSIIHIKAEVAADVAASGIPCMAHEKLDVA